MFTSEHSFVIKLKRVKILDFIISGCILHTKISRMVIFRLVFLSSKVLTLSWRRFLSYWLICSANQWTGFCITGTSVMKDSRGCSSVSTESLLLHAVRHNLLFLFCFFYFYLAFFYDYSRFTGQQVEGETISLYPFYHFRLLHRHLDISWVIAAESSPLRIAGSLNRIWNLWYTLFRIHSFYTCTGSC